MWAWHRQFELAFARQLNRVHANPIISLLFGYNALHTHTHTHSTTNTPKKKYFWYIKKIIRPSSPSLQGFSCLQAIRTSKPYELFLGPRVVHCFRQDARGHKILLQWKSWPPLPTLPLSHNEVPAALRPTSPSLTETSETCSLYTHALETVIKLLWL